MKIIIFGATGSIGTLLVCRGLELGHHVTALARNPEKLALRHERLTLWQADVLEANSVEKAMNGQDAVLCSLGAGAKGQVRSTGTQNIIRAMQAKGCMRLICQTTLGVGESWSNLNFLWKYLMFGLLLRNAFKDHVAQEHSVTTSDRVWTIVRPSVFTNAPPSGTYRRAFGPDEKGLSLKIARADVAEFMLEQLACRSYLNQAVALSN